MKLRELKEITQDAEYKPDSGLISTTDHPFYQTVWNTNLILDLIGRIEKLSDALDKIRDPRKRDHTEPDAYTSLGCVMNIADEAIFNYGPEVDLSS